jgi:hypothetical protein
VCVENGTTQEQVVFPSQAPSVQVVIEVSGEPLDGLEVCLLDREKKVVLRMDPSAAEFVPTRARERLPLRGYCSTTLCRHFDEPPTWKSLQAFKDTKNFTIAVAISLSKRLIVIAERSQFLPILV